jgi:hypothetical protein
MILDHFKKIFQGLLPESTRRKQAIFKKGSLFYSHCDPEDISMAMSKSTGIMAVLVLGLSVACVGLLVALLVKSDISGTKSSSQSGNHGGSPTISESKEDGYEVNIFICSGPGSNQRPAQADTIFEHHKYQLE